MPKKVDLREKARKLKAFFIREKRLPGYNEMLKIFGYVSKNGVHGLLLRLSEAGYIRKVGRKIALTNRITGRTKVLGTIQAGFPSPAEEELIDTISLDEFLIRRPEATFMLKVTGDSMIGAGIQPGDMALVERGATPKSNDIVIAHVDGEWTMKYFVKDHKGVRLEAANKKYKTIYPKKSLEIGGVVRSVIRKYG